MARKSKYMTIGQIDATGVRGPHEKELEDISEAKHHVFIDLKNDILNDIVDNDLGAIIENIGFDEDWTISIEFFPEVNVHMSYTYYGDEFGDGIEAGLKFYFSGERVYWVPGEDIATYIDIIMDFIERRIEKKDPFESDFREKSELMEKVLVQRESPFKLLKENDKAELDAFLGSKVWFTVNGWRFKREFFPEFYIEITWDKEKGLDIAYSGNNLHKMNNYHAEFIGIFFINHILRFITVKNEDEKLPEICYIMFSRFYSKLKNWDHVRS